MAQSMGQTAWDVSGRKGMLRRERGHKKTELYYSTIMQFTDDSSRVNATRNLSEPGSADPTYIFTCP